MGVSHDTAPIHVREQLSLSSERLLGALRLGCLHVAECAILSTCNRFELYALSQNPGAAEEVLAAVFGEQISALRPYIYARYNKEAVQHLLRVASGVESLVLGEVQILGQVQRAWQAAHKAGAAGPVLSQLFNRAVALGKRVHNETSISRQPASVSFAAVVLARQIFGPQLAERRAVVIGTGEVGEGVARCLYDHGVRATVVAHRQIERAEEVARRYHAEVATWDELPRCLAGADIVVSSTAAPHYILQRQQISEAIRDRDGKPLYLIDLAVPRDIDPASGELPGVYLHNVDDLQAVVRTTLRERQSALPEIEGMVETETAKFIAWLRARSTAPTIQELHVHSQEVLRSELKWAAAKLPDVSPREWRVVEVLASRIAGKLLHGPIQWLKAQWRARHLTAKNPTMECRASARRSLRGFSTGRPTGPQRVENKSRKASQYGA